MEHLKSPSENNLNKEYKLCILGQGGVGKSSLALKFVKGIFISQYDPTIEDVYKKTVEVDGKDCIVEILDTAGTESFTAMRDLYIRNSEGFIMVYSITSEGTFDELRQIYNQIMNIKKQQPALLLVGNKIDVSKSERVVEREKGQLLADQWMCPFFETSAKDSINVDRIFIDLIRQLNHRSPYVRKASRQENMPLPIMLPFKKYFCCPFFPRKQQRQTEPISSQSEKF